jgi:anti-sigma regulatory factor (Ser/Thr protein kinase)
MVDNCLRSTLEQDFETGLSFVSLEGPLDVASTPRARAEMLKSAAEHPQAIIVDVNRVQVSHRKALLMFATTARHLNDEGIGLLIVADPATLIGRAVRRMLAGRVDVRASEEEAIVVTQAAAPAHRVHTHLPASPTSPAVARALVRSACESWELTNIADSAEIVVSELVTNAVTHAQTNLDVTVVRRTQHVVIQVRDHGSAALIPTGSGQRPVSSTRGRGLPLVELLTSGWGRSRGPSGKGVWATIRIPHDA